MQTKWNFELIYPNISEWTKLKDSLKEELENISAFVGKLNNEKTLEAFLKVEESIVLNLVNLYVYASMNYDLNQKNVENLGRFQEIRGLYNEFVSKMAFANPEILKLGEENIEQYAKVMSKVKENLFNLKKIFHKELHILDAKNEAIMANYNNLSQNNSSLYSSLAVSDNYSKEVILTDGTKLKISNSNYRSYLESLPNQADRKIVFEAVFKYYADHKSTFASIYNGIIQDNIANMKNRKYNSCVESYLFGNNIPISVYETLINTTKENTEFVKKYIQLRKKAFNIEEYHTYDRFLSFAKVDKEFTYEKSVEMFIEAAKKIGGEFLEKAKMALADGHVDVYEEEGKRTGAYSTSINNVGPFILLNHNNRIDDAFTIAHEAGHSMHTLFAMENQPFPTQDYTIFVAEIASTFNEQLFLDYLIENTKDDQFKLVLLQSAIDGMLATFYRQSLFADYELQAHQLGEKSQSITHESLSNIMVDLYKRYYDIDINNEQYKKYIWSYIPHFFGSPFYVYQYATSFAASLQIYQEVKNHIPNALENYLNLLKSGGNDYPVNQVKKAGVDLTSEKPFLAVVNRLEELVSKLETILNK